MKNKNTVVYGESRLNDDATHRVQSIFFDNFKRSIKLSVRKGIQVDIMELTMEKAQEIGLINIKAIEPFLK